MYVWWTAAGDFPRGFPCHSISRREGVTNWEGVSVSPPKWGITWCRNCCPCQQCPAVWERTHFHLKVRILEHGKVLRSAHSVCPAWLSREGRCPRQGWATAQVWGPICRLHSSTQKPSKLTTTQSIFRINVYNDVDRITWIFQRILIRNCISLSLLFWGPTGDFHHFGGSCTHHCHLGPSTHTK